MYRLMSLAALTFCLTTILVPAQLVARDDGRFANSPLKPSFRKVPWLDSRTRRTGLHPSHSRQKAGVAMFARVSVPPC
jgi:hypothetical protein